MIKPIETYYGGYKFRSRVEARWAVFFNKLKIPFEYEKEGYEIDGVKYLPDFWLPQQKFFVEIKGAAPSKEELKKIKKMAFNGLAPVALFIGPPTCIFEGGGGSNAIGMFFSLDTTESGAGGYYFCNNVHWAFCNTCQVFTLDFIDERYENGRRTLCNPDWSTWENPCSCFPPNKIHSTFGECLDAGKMANMARFEFNK